MRANCMLWLVLVGVAQVGVGAEETEPVSMPPVLENLLELPSPAGSGSLAPFLNSLEDGKLLLSWLEPAGEAYQLRFSTFDGHRWSPPSTVTQSTDYFVNWADVPSVFPFGQGNLAAHTLVKSGPDTFAYDVVLHLSKDNGKTWSKGFRPHDDGTQTEHGFVSYFRRPDGRLGVVWLDGRKYAKPADEPQEEKGMKGEMTLRAAAVSPDGTVADSAVLDERTCDCCPTAATPISGGVLIAYRDRTKEEVRDISVVRLVKGSWSKPVSAPADNWKLPGCPVNGPSLSSDGEKTVAATWFTGAGGKPHVLATFSHDAGLTFAPAVVVDRGRPLGRADVELLDDGTALVSWIELYGEEAALHLRSVKPGGDLGPILTVTPMAASRASGYPRMARMGEKLLFAWTAVSEGATNIRVAAAPFPGPDPN